jgi:hypothetical protein
MLVPERNISVEFSFVNITDNKIIHNSSAFYV